MSVLFSFSPLVQTFVISFLLQIIFFVVAFVWQTDKFTDLAYAASFIVITIYFLLRNPAASFWQLILALLVILWAVRLGVYLFIRILAIKKDERFDQMRGHFLKYLQFWLLQALTIAVVISPVSLVLAKAKPADPQGLQRWPLIAGLLIWLIGLGLETVADWQKFQFKNRSANKGKWVDVGLWQYSRHPNYFGEMLCWWGVYIFSLSFLIGWEFLTVVSPVFITLLLRFVSGVPILEKKYDERFKNNDGYKQYKQQTNLLIPCFKDK